MNTLMVYGIIIGEIKKTKKSKKNSLPLIVTSQSIYYHRLRVQRPYDKLDLI
jgi:hypothetical protein